MSTNFLSDASVSLATYVYWPKAGDNLPSADDTQITLWAIEDHLESN